MFSAFASSSSTTASTTRQFWDTWRWGILQLNLRLNPQISIFPSPNVKTFCDAGSSPKEPGSERPWATFKKRSVFLHSSSVMEIYSNSSNNFWPLVYLLTVYNLKMTTSHQVYFKHYSIYICISTQTARMWCFVQIWE